MLQSRDILVGAVWRSGSTLNKTEEILNDTDILSVRSIIDKRVIQNKYLKI